MTAPPNAADAGITHRLQPPAVFTNAVPETAAHLAAAWSLLTSKPAFTGSNWLLVRPPTPRPASTACACRKPHLAAFPLPPKANRSKISPTMSRNLFNNSAALGQSNVICPFGLISPPARPPC